MQKFSSFSKKQLTVLTWWNSEKYKHHDAIICDGAVRSGKTLCMSLSFVAWAMATFNNSSFALCGKTITSLKRNVTTPLISLLKSFGFSCLERISKNYIDITFKNRTNRFYVFGGKDESSAALIQGMTLSGVMLDEVALMPRSFVEQALARCSVTGSKLWFNCNPEHPYHWFYKEWIEKANEKNALYLHFTMKDNPSLSPEIIERYNSLYSGVFYERFILGKWTAVTGLVYPMFDKEKHVVKFPPICSEYVVSCDYGTVNPSSFGLWGKSNGVWYRVDEYYYSSREKGISRTDEEHYTALEQLCEGKKINAVIVDPSAASFIECIRRHQKFKVIPAKNDVLSGIRRVSDMLKQGKLMFCDCCKDTLREFSLYCWDSKSGVDSPVKENDHAMDDIRYFVSTYLIQQSDDFFVASLRR
jgi:PBSX family phage terminase large subunit